MTTPNIPGTPPTRLTMREAAALIGVNQGGLLKLRAKGTPTFDAAFPAFENQSFDRTAVLAWKQARTGHITTPEVAK